MPIQICYCENCNHWKNMPTFKLRNIRSKSWKPATKNWYIKSWKFIKWKSKGRCSLHTETEWIIKKRPSKKRTAETSPEIQNTSKNDEGKSKNEVNTNEKQVPKKLPTSKPPPIMVSSVSDYQEFYKLTNLLIWPLQPVTGLGK